MLSAPVLEHPATAEAPPAASTPPETRSCEPEMQTEAFDFIARRVLEKGAEFFDG